MISTHNNKNYEIRIRIELFSEKYGSAHSRSIFFLITNNNGSVNFISIITQILCKTCSRWTNCLKASVIYIILKRQKSRTDFFFLFLKIINVFLKLDDIMKIVLGDYYLGSNCTQPNCTDLSRTNQSFRWLKIKLW